jgi:putative heme iron utilization protein
MIEKARALAQNRGFGILATVSKKKPGFPFASLTPYALDVDARPKLGDGSELDAVTG